MTGMSARTVSTAVLRLDGRLMEVSYKPIKNLRLRVLPPDGRLAVSAPLGVPLERIEDFVVANRAWIARSQTTVRMAAPAQEPLTDGGRARLWGRWHEVSVAGGSKASARLDGGVLRLVGEDDAARRRALDGLYRRELALALEPLLDRWCARVGRSPSSVRWRRMTSRWGTCNTRTAVVTLNVALAELEPWALEYVLVHELVHLHERGHGAGFTRWMDALLPEWRVRRRALRGRP